jgi:hypothetical protein
MHVDYAAMAFALDFELPSNYSHNRKEKEKEKEKSSSFLLPSSTSSSSLILNPQSLTNESSIRA